MKSIKAVLKSKPIGKIIIIVASIMLSYLLISLLFTTHYFFNTTINGVNVSLKSLDDTNNIIKTYIKDYKLKLIERDGETEEILGQDIGMQYNEKNNISEIHKKQNQFKWISSFFSNQEYYLDDLFLYNKEALENRISKLNCLNKEVIEPKNVSFEYSNGSYEEVKEVYGNKIYKDKLNEAITLSISKGNITLDLDENLCYDNPKYTLSSRKTMTTKNLLNKCISAKITYLFGDKREILDSDTINKWLSVDENLDVVINEKLIKEYVEALGKKYDTVGISRKIKASTGKIIEVNGGFYGWKINCAAEKKSLLESIKQGESLEKEPIYSQKGVCREENDIGSSYVEINITRQHLWFYKNGKLITQGEVVTGDPSKGNSTKLGVYMVNYKEKDSTLRGDNYESKVTYWMPFNGNIGIHDASWRYSFGGNIYKGNGTHGCVNAPLYLAKTIFNNIEEGTPIICYEE
ncbi:L,D-transpeptidase family protein [Clostridium sp. HBUAS56017]|uniref:L,D-transpeptidase family protein n=1 Tax=Clostridium sp. HBUAS56017 TaxID=2571128 RepID=UPI0011789F83|nr:L,D-transpeptidase family protein [Clostridium sp. HBUAS56017]